VLALNFNDTSANTLAAAFIKSNNSNNSYPAYEELVSGSSPYGATFEQGSVVKISNSIKKFGAGSLYLDGTYSVKLRSSDTTIFDNNGFIYTLDFWVYPTGNYSNIPLLGIKTVRESSSAYTFELRFDIDNNSIYFRTDSAGPYSYPVNMNAWNHIAVTWRPDTGGSDGRSVRLYVNGVNKKNDITAPSQGQNEPKIYLGGKTEFGYSQGYIDGLRISKVDRYAAYPNVNDTFDVPVVEATESAVTQPTYADYYIPFANNASKTQTLYSSGNILWNPTTQTMTVTGNIVTTGYLIGNVAGTSGGGSTYSNTNVASYLPTYSGSVNNLTVNSLTMSGVQYTRGVIEQTNVVAAAPGTTENIDLMANAVSYWTSNTTANVTVNLRGNSTTTLDSIMSVGQSTSIALVLKNGTTGYMPNIFQIDGSTVTTKWLDGTAPSAGSANSLDVWNFNIIKTASATFTVLASQSKFA
jgi:hypothetical protein